MRTILLTLTLVWAQGVLAQDPAVVANGTGQMNWTDGQIMAVFNGEQTIWPSGLPAVVVLPASESDSFEKTAAWCFDTDGFEYQKHWLSLVFQGRTAPPVFVDSEQEVLQYVEEHPGAIGLLHALEAPSDIRLRLQ